MTTLIAVYNSDGCVGRCDARCYLAISPDCDCICGSLDHGAGIERASDNTRQLTEQWIERYSKEHNLTEAKWDLPLNQLNLF